MATLLKRSIEVPFKVPYDREEHRNLREKTLQKYVDKYRAKHPTSNVVGKIIRWHVADGYAEYMVVSEKPLKLQHVYDGDGYSVPYSTIRGLRLNEVAAMVAMEDRLSNLLNS